MHEIRGEFDLCQRLMSEPRRDESWPTLEFHELMACSVFHQGRFDDAIGHAERALDSADPDRPNPYVSQYGESAYVRAHTWIAMALWFRGFPDRAAQRLREGIAVAEGPSLLLSLSNARSMMASLYQLRRQREPTLEWARGAMAVAREHRFPYRVAMGLMLEGWALALDGDDDRGIAGIRQGLAMSRDLGVELDRPYFLGLLAEACGANDRMEEGLEALAEAIAFVESTRRYFFEAELHRLRGALLLAVAPGEASAAEESLRRALEVAREQGAKSLELRAALTLGRLWADQGRRDEARSLVSEVHGWFTEGFDTPDLLESRDLLTILE